MQGVVGPLKSMAVFMAYEWGVIRAPRISDTWDDPQSIPLVFQHDPVTTWVFCCQFGPP